MKPVYRIVFILACLLLGVHSGHADGGTTRDVPEQVLVRFAKSTSRRDADRALNNKAFEVTEELVPALDIFLVRLKPGTSTRVALQELKANPLLAWAQADHKLELRAVPNDDQFASQWNLQQTSDHDVDAPEAWDITTGGTDPGGNEIVVAVVDDGALLTHLDLADNLWTNSHEIAGNGVDDDANGYVDDIYGWDAVGNDGGIPTPTAPYHGTHVAGIIGARGNNGRHVAGVAWNVKLMIVAASNTSTSVVTRGYNYILTQKTRWWQSGGAAGANVVAANSSFGVNYADCESGDYPLWNDLYNALGAVGVLSSCATANQAIDVDVQGDVPTGCSSPFIIAVTNTDRFDARNASAAWGRTTVDLGAPGTSVLSTINTGTGSLTGTSMAAPHVAGAIALMHAAASSAFYQYYGSHPDSGALLLKQMLLDGIDPLPGFDTLTVAGGRLNLYPALVAVREWIGTPSAVPFLVVGNVTADDSGTGDDDGFLENSEEARLYIAVSNFGAEASTVNGTLSTTDPYLMILDSTALFGDIPADSTRSNLTQPFVLAATAGAPFGHVAQLALELTTNSGYSVIRQLTISLGQMTVFWSDNMESGASGWTHAGVLPGFIDEWHISTDTSSSPNHAYKCGNTNGGLYAIHLDAGLVTPAITLLPDSRLVFAQWIESETSILYPDSAFDGGVVELSVNSGAFVPLTPVGGYPKAFRTVRGTGSYNGPMPGRPCFAGSAGWRTQEVDLAAWAGQSVQIRFRFGSDSTTSKRGWYIDDVELRGRVPNLVPPALSHDPLADFASGSGTIRAFASSNESTVDGVKLFYRPVGAAWFDSLSLTLTGNPHEYAASLAAIASGRWEYYVRAHDLLGLASYVPNIFVENYYTFDVDALCAAQLAYDDGSAESFNYADSDSESVFEWAVKFGPVLTPFSLYGARFAAARSVPDSAHSRVTVKVYLADGPDGLPGTLVAEDLTGSVGNVVGGLPVGTNWAEAILNDSTGGPLTIDASEFYIAVSNSESGKIEAFGRDTSSVSNLRSVYYDGCEHQWFIEDDVFDDNAHPGNRLIRVRGYSRIPPVLTHDPLADFATGAGTIRVLASSAVSSIGSVTLFYRPAGATLFDSLSLSLTGNPHEYAASLAALSAGTWEYYVRAQDLLGMVTYVPNIFVENNYHFDVGALSAAQLIYDDGGAEMYNYVHSDSQMVFEWAVKFGPVATPYILSGARFAAARTLPDSTHNLVAVKVYLADGPAGMPGTLVNQGLTGSVGNVIGGLPAGTNWAEVILKDSAGHPLTINTSEFYVAVSRSEIGKVEAFGRDTSGTNSHRSVFYDGCASQWFSEDNTAGSSNAYPGNRMIRARGYNLTPPQVVMYLNGNDIRLSWPRTGASLYHVSRAVTSAGPFTFMQSTADTFLTVSRADTANVKLFFEVMSATE